MLIALATPRVSASVEECLEKVGHFIAEAAGRGAKIVFPHRTDSDKAGVVPTQWVSPNGPYYEKAMMCRGPENSSYSASVNYVFRYPESASCVIGPEGECLARLPYDEEGLQVREADLAAATGLFASRYAPERYRESRSCHGVDLTSSRRSVEDRHVPRAGRRSRAAEGDSAPKWSFFDQ